MKNKIYYILCVMIILFVSLGIVSATDNNITHDIYENDNTNIENNNQVEIEKNTIIQEKEKYENSNDKAIHKDEKTDDKQIKTDTNNNTPNLLTLNVSVVNTSIPLVSDIDMEVAITKNITTVNGMPDVTKLGVDYAYADENGTYTIEGSEIRRVMKLDSYCQQIYGFTPKYTFFRAIGSNVKYVISREKWNVIARSLNGYHVNQGFNAVDTPYAITVNLSGKSRYYCVYYDAQERINGIRYTCGPTSMSMISQFLNCYASERKLSGVYKTTSWDGTSEYNIIQYSPSVHMKLTDIFDTESAVISALNSGKVIFWHIAGHYMCIIDYNNISKQFLALNPSGPSHNIEQVQWATWSEILKTDRALKDRGFMAVSPYWNLTSTDKTHAMYYYYNMGGKYTIPANNEYCNNGYDNKVNVTVNQPSKIINTTNQTTLHIKSEVKGNNGLINNGNITIYLDEKILTSMNVKNGNVNYNYTLPAYTSDNITVKAQYVNQTTKYNDTNATFKKFSAGNNYYNSTILFSGTANVYNITAKKGDNVTFTAYLLDSNLKAINNGKAVFKINGETIKENNNPLKVNVVNGFARLNYSIPAYSARDYNITVVYGNSTTRLESNATLTILKSSISITNLSFTDDNQTGLLYGNIIDEKDDNLDKDTKISVKIDGITVFNKLTVKDGIINLTIDLSRYNEGNHTFTICIGEGGVYKSLKLTENFTKTCENAVNVNTTISNVNIVKSDNLYTITASIINDNNIRINDNVKLSIKLNGKTIVKQTIVKEGLINQTLDLSKYKINTYTLTLITGKTRTYESSILNTTIKTY